MTTCQNCKRPIGREAHDTPLYVDECCARAIPQMLRKMGFCVVPQRTGAQDVDWLPEAGRRGWTVITQDSRIVSNHDEFQALIANNVKCFILPPAATGAWEQVRAFAGAWEKIVAESRYPGPFVWKINDETSPVRWEALHPKPAGFSPLDLSKIPVGHLLNLFADIVHQQDEGSFSVEFVEGLHDNIRRELEARIEGRKLATPPRLGVPLLQRRIDAEAGSGVDAKLDNPFHPGELGFLEIGMSLDSGEEYLWIVPSHRIRPTFAGDKDFTDRSFAFSAGRTGFRRSGLGLRLAGFPKPLRRR